ncbi:MAG: 3-oxoacyl-ACP synthase [Deltaproteobacteria bacterium]|nr:3-oxoacyl-ACP synthase [Deltaproteobacteria bacterium]
MSISVGMRSLATAFPRIVRNNAHFRERHPEVVAAAEEKALARLWQKGAPRNPFASEMEPYLADPFRGAVERRVLAPDESALSIELKAAQEALAAARLGGRDVDCIIVASFLPNQIGVGNAPRLAEAIGARCAAWNLETACSGSVVGLQTASALVRSGEHRQVLVVASCTYSRYVDERDTLSWFLGDGAGAFVVGPVEEGLGYLGGTSIHSADTCGTFSWELEVDEEGYPRIGMVASPSTGRVLAETAEKYVRECCVRAADRAGVRLSDIELFVFHTPVPWFAPFAARVLGVAPERTTSVNAWTANIGPALMPANLHHAARLGRLRRGDLVMVQSIGSASSAAAAVMRWNEPALGPRAL